MTDDPVDVLRLTPSESADRMMTSDLISNRLTLGAVAALFWRSAAWLC
ncbi:MAG: hypothetical protein MIO92_13235 [Methanosarcinaceae archaeon]|nr:hypothetical protein [Methanosarcinaceae archaeon]